MRLLCKPENDPSAFIKTAFDDLSSTLGCWDHKGVFDVEIEEIEHTAHDGFIPFTNGGWTGRASVSFRNGKDVFRCMSGYEESDYKDMLSEFRDALKNGHYKRLEVKRRSEIKPLPAGSADWTDQEVWDFYSEEDVFDDGRQLELFQRKDIGWRYCEPLAYTWRDGWEEGDDSVFYLDFRAVFYASDNSHNETGEDEVYFFAGINTDFNYGRDNIAWLKPSNQHCLEYGKTVKLKDLTPAIVKEITGAMEEFFSEA